MNNVSGLMATSFLVFICAQGCVEPPVACEDQEDQISAVLNTLDCVVLEDALCAIEGYDNNFVKLHNGVDTETEMSLIYWMGGFEFADFAIDIEYVTFDEQKNAVDIKYLETVTVDGQDYLQNEQAFVSLNEACKMTLWDQYGEVEEQEAVDNAVNALLERLGIPPI